MRPLGTDDPTRVGEYRMLGVLGAGGMGRVYLGRSKRGRTVAVKVVRPELADDTTFRMRFQREVTAARRVGGRYTAAVLDADVESEQPWLATRYIAGFSLREAVGAYGRLPEHSLHVLALGLVRALIAVHAAGIVHRDLKPSNVLLAVDGPKVIDFGIARAADDSVLTTTGNLVGSPGFMCPEQVTGAAPVGPAGDVFSLGGVLVYAASGQGPFGEGDTMSMLWRVVQEPPQLAAVPERLRPIVASCLVKDPQQRPTLHVLLDRLTALGEPDSAGWLPPLVLEEVSRRAVELLDLETDHTDDPEPTPVPLSKADRITGPTASMAGFGTPMVASGSVRADPAREAPTMARSFAMPEMPTPVGISRPPAPPAPTRRRLQLVVAALVVAILVAGAVVLTVALGNHSKGSSGTTPTAAGTASATAAATASVTAAGTASATATATSSDTLPNGYAGTWKGTASDGMGSYTIELTLHTGKVGDQIGTSSNTGQVVGLKCGRTETLTTASSSEITLTAKLSEDSGGCNDNGATSHVALQGNGTLSYRTLGVGSDMAGTLSKS